MCNGPRDLPSHELGDTEKGDSGHILTSTEIGVQLDSLADVLTFGIAPIVMIYCWAIGATFDESNALHGFGVFQ